MTRGLDPQEVIIQGPPLKGHAKNKNVKNQEKMTKPKTKTIWDQLLGLVILLCKLNRYVYKEMPIALKIHINQGFTSVLLSHKGPGTI